MSDDYSSLGGEDDLGSEAIAAQDERMRHGVCALTELGPAIVKERCLVTGNCIAGKAYPVPALQRSHITQNN
jgi:hypothetical protein